MSEPATVKRVNVYVVPEDLERVARELGCRPSEAVRRLIDNYLLASEIDEARRMPGRPPDAVFRQGPGYTLSAAPNDDPSDDADLASVE